MSTEVKVPAVGESISSGVVSVWHKKSGELVSAGDPLFTLETDKVSTEINAEKDGVLKTLVAEGAEVKIGDVVATIEEGTASDAKTEKKAEPAAMGPIGPMGRMEGNAPGGTANAAVLDGILRDALSDLTGVVPEAFTPVGEILASLIRERPPGRRRAQRTCRS